MTNSETMLKVICSPPIEHRRRLVLQCNTSNVGLAEVIGLVEHERVDLPVPFTRARNRQVESMMPSSAW